MRCSTSSAAAPCCDGVRGRAGVDLASLATLVAGLSTLAMRRPDIVELDLNPVIATPDGVVAVDALVVIAAEETSHG